MYARLYARFTRHEGGSHIECNWREWVCLGNRSLFAFALTLDARWGIEPYVRVEDCKDAKIPNLRIEFENFQQIPIEYDYQLFR